VARAILTANQFPQFRFPEKESFPMSSYLSAIAAFLMVLSPLFIPVAVSVAPLASAGIRRVSRVVGMRRPAPRFA
jgi:hypothetical protein